MTYKDAGVDKEKGYQHVKNIQSMINETKNENVLNELGAFSALYRLDQDLKEPVLVSGTDGVGTKLILSERYKSYYNLGIDCVAMSVNDILCQGAQPLFFLDYIASGTLNLERAKELVAGMVDGCKQSKMALIGGESAEMPGVYDNNTFDLAGFAVGVVDYEKRIVGQDVKVGDVIVGLPSNGIHSNGFSLIRHIYDDTMLETVEFDNAKKLYELLLEPTRIYVQDYHKIKDVVTIKAMAHITGGGVIENIPRALNHQYKAKLNTQTIPKQALYQFINETSNIEGDELYATFNMGVGFIFVLDKNDVEKCLHCLPDSFVFGTVEEGSGVELVHA
ncbi:phosphoribosylformylglycinamidine cyclo-ligase [Erysipelothrix urinaevulpis]|uniref:phosphoribosylformylglycinamidine cyclo-ligase n=1 Tax=Erysipelothrix urinaevulpis TaxID=2683717 RepID=UPI0013597055|nr:phosphoribosylformylglycinamidine cyclo-ligase [Erysipelothrix urinaevulpis]